MSKERQTATRKDKRGRILKKGEGQDSKGRYFYNYVDNFGKRKRIYNTDLIELREKEREIQKALEDNIDLEAAERTLNEQFDLYMRTKNIKLTTRQHYTYHWNLHIKNTIGRKKLCDIRKSDILIFYNELSASGIKDTTLHTYSALLYPVLEMALNDDIIRKNPAKNCMKAYSNKSKEKKILTKEQQECLLEYIANSNRYSHYLPLVMFMLATACRAGEVMGLTWDNIDLKKRIITIDHQLRYLELDNGYQFYNTTPKTESGVRQIPITDNCYKALINQREHQFIMCIRHDVEVAGLKNFVFTTKNSTPYDPNNLNKLLDNIVRGYNKAETEQAHKQKRTPQLLPHVSCHVLRHTACTRLAENNIDIKVLQVFMGHSDISTTMNIYNHVDQDRIMSEVLRAGSEKVI